MKKQFNAIFSLAMVALVAGAAGYYIYRDIPAKDPMHRSGKGDSETIVTSVDVGANVVGGVEFEEGTEGVRVPSTGEGLPPPPSVDYPLVFYGSFPADVQARMTRTIQDLRDIVRDDPNQFNSWLDLGLQYKAIEDYEGAKGAWEYASLIRPKNDISFLNLGNLYGYHLRDVKKAEKNYLMSIENNTTPLQPYYQLAEFYRQIVKDEKKVQEVLDLGLKNNPNLPEFKEFAELF
jgi:hypothetical protein